MEIFLQVLRTQRLAAGIPSRYAAAIVKTAWARAMKQARGGLTQERVAAALEVRQSAISKWEQGKGLPELETLLRYAALLGLDVNHLVYGLSDQYDQLGLTSPVSGESTNRGTKKKGGASDVIPASAQARIRELERELTDLKAAIRQRALDLTELATDEARLRPTRAHSTRRGRKGAAVS